MSTVSITAVGEGLRLVSIVLLGGGMYGYTSEEGDFILSATGKSVNK